MDLRVDGLGVAFPRTGAGPLTVLDRVSFEVQQGQFVALVGPSGCGKTTVLRCMSGLQALSAGRIAIGGRPIAGVDRRVAMVFQSDSLFPWRTVTGNVAFGLEVRRYAAARAAAIVQDLVELVGLAGFERAYPHQLSGGMRQRVNLARALAVDPEVLLMDEPFSSLDMLTRESMQLELQRIWLQRKKTVLFVTHQIEEAVFLADRVLLMSRRPGTVRADVAVPFARPRSTRDRHTPEFHALVDGLAESLGAELADQGSAGKPVPALNA
ncbi:MAG TPA: ABC transporter ATP-binding protein [bacterium]|nr:ABC transporter ATP-binding protein [bacterium]